MATFGGGGSNGMATTGPGMFGDGGGMPLYDRSGSGMMGLSPAKKKKKKPAEKKPVLTATRQQKESASKKRARRTGRMLLSPSRFNGQGEDQGTLGGGV